jgi:hypothetical protein
LTYKNEELKKIFEEYSWRGEKSPGGIIPPTLALPVVHSTSSENNLGTFSETSSRQKNKSRIFSCSQFLKIAPVALTPLTSCPFYFDRIKILSFQPLLCPHLHLHIIRKF